MYRKHEQERDKAMKEELKWSREHSLLLFSTAGGWGPSARVTYKCLANMIAEKHDNLRIPLSDS